MVKIATTLVKLSDRPVKGGYVIPPVEIPVSSESLLLDPLDYGNYADESMLYVWTVGIGGTPIAFLDEVRIDSDAVDLEGWTYDDLDLEWKRTSVTDWAEFADGFIDATTHWYLAGSGGQGIGESSELWEIFDDPDHDDGSPDHGEQWADFQFRVVAKNGGEVAGYGAAVNVTFEYYQQS